MRTFDDFHTGQHFDIGSYVLSKDEIVAFAREYDPQPFHLDEAAGKASLLGGLCASGWHGCAILMRMLCDGLLNETASKGSGGIEQVRWLRPIFPGTLRAEMDVVSTRASRSRDDLGFVNARFRLLNEGGEVLMVMEAALMQGRRPGAAAGDVIEDGEAAQ
ncbi:MAG: hypothetical protein C0606_09695 [Hyphomicrobiales bacterium]|nr:MAG: hypothetical protein C0606_09695 [Hyphomicrobiales bacterium]